MNKSFGKYELDASAFRLREGDRISPEDEIGIDFETGQTVFADFSGTVVSVGFHSGNHSLIVTIQVEIESLS